MSDERLDELPLGTRRVLVTGGGSGIGLAIAEALLAGGGKVAVAGRRREPLEALAARFPGRAFALPCDVTDAAMREGLLKEAKDRLGGMDGMVLAAGVAFHQAPGVIEEEALRSQLEVNLVAPLRLGEAALQILSPGGAVVFISSNLAHRPLETSAVYSASKAGLLAAMRSFSLAGAKRKIRFGAVSPGVVDTDMIRSRHLSEEGMRELAGGIPLGRLGEPREVAEAALLLLESPWMTGADLVIDGGSLVA